MTRCVIIDSTPADRAAIGSIVCHMIVGTAVVEVDSPMALEAALGNHADLVIMEYALDWSDGLSVLRQVKARWPHVPVIVATGAGSEAVAVAVMKAGASDYVSKRDIERLAPAIRESMLATVPHAASFDTPGIVEHPLVQTVLDKLPVPIAYLDCELVYRSCNAAAAQHLGRPREKIIGHHLHEVVPDNPIIWDAIAGVLATGEPFEKIIRFTWADRPELGERVYRVSLLPHRNAQHEIAGCLSEGEDLTEWVRAQEVVEEQRAYLVTEVAERTAELTQARQSMATLVETLQISEARYRAMFNEHSAPKLLIDPTSGEILDANPAALEFYGYAYHDLTALKITDLNILPINEVHIKMAEARQAEQVYFEFQHRLANGEIRDVAVYSSPIHFNDRTVLYSIIHDVTEQRQLAVEVERRAGELDATFEAIASPVLIYGPDGSLVRMNGAALDLLNYTPEQRARSLSERVRRIHLQRPDGQELPPEELPAMRAMRGEGVNRELIKLRPREDGPWVWAIMSAAPIYGANDEQLGTRQLLGAVTVLMDITEQQQLLAQVQRQAAELSATFEALPDGLIIHGRNGEVLQMNSAAERMQGYSPEDRELPLNERAPTMEIWWEDNTPVKDPAELPPARAQRGETVKGTLLSWRPYTVDERRWFSVSAAPIRTADGEIVGTVSSFADITERQRLFNQVERQAAEMAGVLDAIADGVIVYDPDGHVQRINEAAQRLLRTVPQAQAGPGPAWARCRRVTTPLGQPYAREDLPDLRALRGEIVQSETLAVWPDSHAEPLWLSTSAAPIVTSTGKSIGAVATFTDVTPLFRIQHELEATNAELEEQTVEVQAQNDALHELSEYLEAERARLQAILGALPVAVTITNANGHVAQNNDLVYEIWGRDRPPATSIEEYAAYKGRWADTGAPLAAEDWALARALEHGEVSTGEVIDIERSDGAEATILNSAAPIHDREGRLIGAVAVSQDITERRVMEAALKQRTQELEVLNRINRTLVGRMALDEVLDAALNELCSLLHVTASSAWLVEERVTEESHDLVCHRICSVEGFCTAAMNLALDEGVAGWVLTHGHSLVVSDVAANPQYAGARDLQLGFDIGAVLSVPLMVKGKVIGVLEIFDAQPRTFGDQQVALAESIAAAAAVAVERAQLYEQVQNDAEVRATLLREVNHRVKNNLAAIIGLLYIERQRPIVAADPKYQAVIDDIINRIQSLAAVHASLSAANWQPLHLNELVDQIVTSTLAGMAGARDLPLRIRGTSVRVTAAQAHHLALVLNELTTNTLKYSAHTQDGDVQITVEIARRDEEIELTFRDGGPGYPENVLGGDGQSVGLSLSRTIVRQSLRGTLAMYNENGAVTRIAFPAAPELEAEGGTQDESYRQTAHPDR